MQEILQQSLGALRGMWHRRWIGLITAWLVAIIAVAIVFRVPERYEASARVYVDTESLLRPLLAGLAIQPNLDQQVSLMSRTLISRPNVEKLVRMADLDLTVRSNAEREELIDSITKTIRLDGNVTSNLYVISYRDVNASQARKVVQSLLTIFVESSLGDKRQDTQTAVKFLDDQIRNYEKTLQSAENKIKDFKLKYMGLSGNSQQQGQDYFGRVALLNAQIETARVELQAAEQARDSYKRELAGETPVFLPEPTEALAQEAVPAVDARIEALKRELDTLLRKYTDQHPDVVATQRLLAQLDEQRKAEIDARQKAAALPGRKGQTPLDQNPVFQQMKISLADAEATVASTRAKLAGLEAQQRQLKSQAALVPQIEAEYIQLVRDYDVQKKTYESLLARRESATMGKDVQDTSGAQFRVIDPPRVSPQPVAPNRLGLLGIAFAFSLAAGLFASLAASQLMPTFHEARTLREVSKRPILGMVSMLPSAMLHRARRRKSWLFASGLGGLLAAFSAVLAVALLVGRTA
jgi:polysaccharide chain length determinant protein (PEP-CTERM system associated)